MIEGLKPYPEYKESRVSWLGNMPEHWRKGPGFAAFREKQVKNTGMREKTVLSLSYGKIVVKPLEKLHGLVPESFETYQIVEPGDIIIRSTDLQNDWNSLRVGLVRDRGIITSAYLCFKTTDTLIPEYGYLLLHAFDLMKIFYGLGSGLRQNLSFSDFKRMVIFVPPPSEQSTIVRFLDTQDRRINHLIHTKRRLIELLNEQKQAIIHQAVTRGLDPNVHLKPSGVEWLGDVPEHWEVMPIKRVLSRLIDTEHKTAPAVEGGRYMVVRTTNIKKGRLVMEKAYFTDENCFRSWTRREVPQPRDILFTREAPAGEACLVPKEVELCMGQRVVLMRADPRRMDPRFVLLLIYHGAIRDYISLRSQGSTVPHFNMSDIASMPALVPPIAEQQEIIITSYEQTKSLDITIEQSRREIDLLREYRTRLISDVVTGKLDVRGVELPAIDETEILEDIDIDEDTEAEELIENEEVPYDD